MANPLGVKWALANPFGISIDDGDVWHSGHVNDVLVLDGGAGLLVATQTGGVWSVPTAGSALPLSNSWDQPDVNCLASGVYSPQHAYAGCNDGVIYETDTTAAAPLLEWRPIAWPLPRA